MVEERNGPVMPTAGFDGAKRGSTMTEPPGNVDDMSVTALRVLLDEMAAANHRSLAERDLRFQQRFEAQAEAISMARSQAQDAAEVARATFVVKETMASVAAKVEGQTELTEAKFVTFRTLIDSQADKVALALAASKEAIDKAEAAAEKARDRLADDMAQRFESVNEFREQQKDIIATFIPRKETEQRIAGLADRTEQLIKGLTEKIDTMTELRLTDLKLVREQVIIADAKLDDRLKTLEAANNHQQGRLGVWAIVITFMITVVVVSVNVILALAT